MNAETQSRRVFLMYKKLILNYLYITLCELCAYVFYTLYLKGIFQLSGQFGGSQIINQMS